MSKEGTEEPRSGSVSEANVKPSKIEDVDRLNFLLSGERINKLVAQISFTELSFKDLVSQLQGLKEKHDSLRQDLIKKYSLDQNFQFDDQTGLIKRS